MKQYILKKEIVTAKSMSDLVYNVILPVGTIFSEKYAGWWYISEGRDSVHFNVDSVENNPEYFELVTV